LKPLLYRSGVEIRKGDRILLHGEPGEVEFVLDGETNPEDWPAEKYGRGVMIAEPKRFGRLFLAERDLADFEDLTFVSRSS
jgi:hypothetical protein